MSENLLTANVAVFVGSAFRAATRATEMEKASAARDSSSEEA
jgi:hypothetical protein